MSEPRPKYTTTPTLPLTGAQTVTEVAFPPEAFREIDGRIIRECLAAYARRYGLELTRELIRALAEKYATD